MTRNRHDRVTDHFGDDLDTNMILDGAIADIPSGTTVHDALRFLLTGGEPDEEEEPPNWADPDLGTLVYIPTFSIEDQLADETVFGGNIGGNTVVNTANANDTTATTGASHFSQTQSERSSFAGGGSISYWWGADFGSSTFITRMRVWNASAIGAPGWALDGGLWTTTLQWSDDGTTYTTSSHTYSSHSVPTGNTFPFATTVTEHIYTLNTASSHRYWRLRKAGSFGLQFVGGDAMGSFYMDGPAVPVWGLAPLIHDGSDTTYEEATYGDECMRVEINQPILAYQAIVRMAFSTPAERTYGFYGTNESDYSDLTLLDEATFTPAGSNVAEDIPFTWTPIASYRYYVLIGPDETRRLHELTIHAQIGAVVTSHPLTINRDLANQHPASAVSFDDTVADLGESSVQGALDKLTANVENGAGVNCIIANVTTGVKYDFEMPFAGSIEAVRLFADQTGSAVLDLWKSTYPNLPPTVANTITASAKPTLSSAVKSQNTTLTGWTTDFEAGDVIRINVDSASILTRITMALRLARKKNRPTNRSISLGRISRTAAAHAPSIIGGLKSISLGLITQAPTLYAPSVAGGSSVAVQPVTLARIARTAVPHAPVITGTAVGGSVFYMSPTGLDTNTGTSTSSPWRSIQKFINTNPAPGSTLYLRGGNYTQAQGGHTGEGVGDLIGTASQPITIRNYPNEIPSFPNMPGATITFRGNTTSNTIGANYVVLNGIRFPGCSPDDEAVLVIGNSGDVSETLYLVKNITIRNCYFSLAPGLTNRDHPSGLVHGCEYITFEDCEFAGPGSGGAGGDGIVLYSTPAARNIVVQRCIFHDWAHMPIQTWDYNETTPAITIQIKHCTFKNNTAPYDIDLRFHSTALVQDCVFDGPSSSSIYDPNDSAVTTLSFNYFNQTLTSTYGLSAGSAAINGAHDGSDAGALDYTGPSGTVSGYFISPTGNDLNSGSELSPWRTIQKFVTVSGPGDTLYCRNGTYTAQPEVSTTGHSGTASEPITITNYPGETPNFVSPKIYIEGGCSYWVIDGITISGPIAASSAQLWIGNGRSIPGSTDTHHITIRNCTIKKEGGAVTAHGIYLSHQAANVTIEDNLIYGVSASLPEDRCAGIHIFHGVLQNQTATATIAQRNIIRRWPKGIVMWDEAGEPPNGGIPTATAQFLHNTFQNCDFHIDNRWHAAVLIRDNVGDNSISHDIYDPNDAAATTADHNYWSQTLTSSGGLTAGSPAINGALDGSDAGAVPYP